MTGNRSLDLRFNLIYCARARIVMVENDMHALIAFVGSLFLKDKRAVYCWLNTAFVI